MRLLKYLLSDLRHNRAFVAFFVLNLCLGLSGFIALDSFKSSVDQAMSNRSRLILGADFGVSARRPISEGEEKFLQGRLPGPSKVAKTTELYSMIAGESGATRLVRIKSVGKNYPFYGGVTFQSGNSTQGPFEVIHGGAFVWIFEELQVQMGLSIGDKLSIGESEFKITKIITDDSTSGMGASFAPTVYLSNDQLAVTGLVQKGSVAWHSRLYFLPDFPHSELERIRDQVFNKTASQDLRVFTHKEASSQMSQLLQRLNDYLGLASLVALFLAAVGTGFLYRNYFNKKINEVAILMTLGLSQFQASLYYLFQLVLLGIMGASLSLVIALFFLPFLRVLTAELLPIDFELILSFKTVLVGFCVGILGSFFICLPFLAQLKNVSPATLIEGNQNYRVASWFQFLLLSLPGFIVFCILAIWQAQSWKVGLSFVFVFLVSGVVLVVIAILALKLLEIAKINTQWISLKWALRDLVREKSISVSCFLALGLGALLLNLIPQLQVTLERELKNPETSLLPSLFLFDIQEDQVKIIESTLNKSKANLTQLSPMVRSRLIQVNGESFDKGIGAGQGLSREEEREMRFRNRGFNLSFRDSMSASESIYSGQKIIGSWSEESSELPKISVEKRFADRLGFKIGDHLKFEIEGVPVEGKIANLRTVKWTSFQPNFFLQFQPGPLDLAPKTYIATIGNLSLKEKRNVQNQIVSVAPNVSIIDVSRLVNKLSSIIAQMGFALQAMAWLCLIAGFVVIFSIVSHQMQKKRWQVGLLKTLGGSFASIRNSILIQYGVLSLVAGSMGVIGSLILSYALSRFLFDSYWVFDWKSPLLSFTAIVLISLLVVFGASWRYLRVEPKSLLS